MSLPIYLAQTSPLSPQPSLHKQSPYLFPSVQHNLHHLRLHLVQASRELKDEGVVVFPEYGLQGILDGFKPYALTAPTLLDHLQHLSTSTSLHLCLTIVEPRFHNPSFLETSTLPPSPFEYPSSATLDPDAAPRILSDKEKEQWEKYERLAEKEGYDLVNAAYFIRPQGVRVRYEKNNLWHPERDYLHPGQTPSLVFDTPWGKAGMLICWDLSHSSATHALIKQGAKIIFAPTFWLSTDSDPIAKKYATDPNSLQTYDTALLPNLCFIRAFEGECVFVMCNPGSAPPPTTSSQTSEEDSFGQLLKDTQLIAHEQNTFKAGFFGESGVWAPLIGLKGGVKGDGAGSWSGEIGMKVVEDGRDVYKIAEDFSKKETS